MLHPLGISSVFRACCFNLIWTAESHLDCWFSCREQELSAICGIDSLACSDEDLLCSRERASPNTSIEHLQCWEVICLQICSGVIP